jgi:hypothetical protein
MVVSRVRHLMCEELIFCTKSNNYHINRSIFLATAVVQFQFTLSYLNLTQQQSCLLANNDFTCKEVTYLYYSNK